jgi:hypothetical protein
MLSNEALYKITSLNEREAAQKYGVHLDPLIFTSCNLKMEQDIGRQIFAYNNL